MAYFAVIDTNVLVSSLLSNHNDSATVIILRKIITRDSAMKNFNAIRDRCTQKLK